MANNIAELFRLTVELSSGRNSWQHVTVSDGKRWPPSFLLFSAEKQKEKRNAWFLCPHGQQTNLSSIPQLYTLHIHTHAHTLFIGPPPPSQSKTWTQKNRNFGATDTKPGFTGTRQGDPLKRSTAAGSSWERGRKKAPKQEGHRGKLFFYFFFTTYSKDSFPSHFYLLCH